MKKNTPKDDIFLSNLNFKFARTAQLQSPATGNSPLKGTVMSTEPTNRQNFDDNSTEFDNS